MTASREYRTAMGLALHDLRQAQHLSLDTVAEAVGITTADLSMIERGQLVPTIDVMTHLAAQFGTTLKAIDTRLRAKLTNDARQSDRAVVEHSDEPRTIAQTFARDIARARAIEMGFTPREQDIAVLFVSGVATGPGVADALGIQRQTVKNHTHAMFVKAGVTDRVQLVLRLLGIR